MTSIRSKLVSFSKSLTRKKHKTLFDLDKYTKCLDEILDSLALENLDNRLVGQKHNNCWNNFFLKPIGNNELDKSYFEMFLQLPLKDLPKSLRIERKEIDKIHNDFYTIYRDILRERVYLEKLKQAGRKKKKINKNKKNKKKTNKKAK